jgi:hypothetical protein
MVFFFIMDAKRNVFCDFKWLAPGQRLMSISSVSGVLG